MWNAATPIVYTLDLAPPRNHYDGTLHWSRSGMLDVACNFKGLSGVHLRCVVFLCSRCASVGAAAACYARGMPKAAAPPLMMIARPKRPILSSHPFLIFSFSMGESDLRN